MTKNRAILTWAALGACFGACFPVMAMGIRYAQTDLAGAVDAVQGDPLLWIIFTAPVFLGAFAAMGGRKQDQVAALNAGLEATVAKRTAELSGALMEVGAARASQEALLAALEVGLVSFDREGRLSQARSAALGRLLPESPKAETIETLLAEGLGASPETTTTVRELLWDESFWSPFEDTVAMLPDRWESEGRALELSFRAVNGVGGELREVLVQVLDRTDARRAELEQEAAKARVERLSNAARSTENFQRFQREVEGLFSLCGDHAGPEHARPLHTIKGLSRIFGFHEVGAQIHEIEGAVVAGRRPAMVSVRNLFCEQVADVCAVLGLLEGQERISVDREAFRRLLLRVDRGTAAHLHQLTTRPAAERLRSHVEAAERLAGRLERAIRVEVIGDPLLDGDLDRLDTALTHVLTNAVTHAAQAEQILQIWVSVSRNERLRVCIEDDGPGIHTARLVEKAVASGRWTPTQAETASEGERLDLVFADGLSAKSDVSDTAGRGVGLGAALAAMRAVGGHLRVEARPGGGARFWVDVPTPDPATAVPFARAV